MGLGMVEGCEEKYFGGLEEGLEEDDEEVKDGEVVEDGDGDRRTCGQK